MLFSSQSDVSRCHSSVTESLTSQSTIPFMVYSKVANAVEDTGVIDFTRLLQV